MNYYELIAQAIEKKEVLKLMRGEKGYEIEISKFTSDVFPTDVNAVLMNCFYKQVENIDVIENVFSEALLRLLSGGASDVYIAVLYFDACLFQEERGKATFLINKELFIKKMQEAICKYKEEFKEEIRFCNGLSKSNAWKNIENFNKYYCKKYQFSIIS